jgi:tRNA(Ile2) C34 agmatinyltransferase TiaS
VRKLLKKMEALFAAAAFAEEGDVETARQIVAEAGNDEPTPDGGRGVRKARGAPRRVPLVARKVARSS